MLQRRCIFQASGRGDLQLFHEAIQACDSYAPAFFQLGVCYSEVSDCIKAKEMYRKAVQLHPGCPERFSNLLWPPRRRSAMRYVEALNNLGVACRELGEWEHAIEAYGMALKVNQNCSKTRENMAISLLQLGCRHLQRKDHLQAGEALKRALTFNSRNADIYFNLGVLYAEKEKWDRAKVNYELANHFDPRHANAHNNLGVIHRLMQRCPLGSKSKGKPDKVDGLVCLRQGLQSTCTAYNRGINALLFQVEDIYVPSTASQLPSRHASQSITSRCSLPSTCMHVNKERLGNAEAAMKCFESALEVDSKMNLASKNLGAIYGSMGRMDDAIRLTRIAIESNRQDAEAYNNLALLLRDQCDLWQHVGSQLG
eukprot:g20722.t1